MRLVRTVNAAWSVDRQFASTVPNLRCHLSTSTCRRYLSQQQQQRRRRPTSGMRFITPPVIRRISATIGQRRRQKTSQSRGSANCPATGHRCGLHRHSRERVILRNYCSGSPRRNARPGRAEPAGVVQSIGGDAIENERR